MKKLRMSVLVFTVAASICVTAVSCTAGSDGGGTGQTDGPAQTTDALTDDAHTADESAACNDPSDETGGEGLNTDGETDLPGGTDGTDAGDVGTDGDVESETAEESRNDAKMIFDDGEEYINVKPDESKYMNVTVTDDGIDIHANQPQDTYGYRYGPSMMLYADGTADAWFASPGCAGLWDYFTYKHSDDAGKTWGQDKVVLQPTPDSMDYPSVCDPGVIWFGGYYYIGYTSTVFSGGVGNNVYVARSKNPDGPYEKWDGNGWGGLPAPIIYYTDDCAGFGAGEPSFVELNGKLYVYYSWNTPSAQTTRVAIADSTREDWPKTISYAGIAMERDTRHNTDSPDVKYVENYGKFIAITVVDRMERESALQFWESNDGLTFYKTNKLSSHVFCCAHNAGLMGRPNGHINTADTLYLAYAYGGTDNAWGKWNTRLQPFTITLGDQIDRSDEENGNIKAPQENVKKDVWVMGLTTRSWEHYERKLSDGKFDVELVWFDTSYVNYDVKKRETVTYSDYDTSIVSFNGITCMPLKIGETYVTAEYKGAKHTFKVTILPDDALIDAEHPAIVSFTSALRYPCDGPVKVTGDGVVTLSYVNRKDRLQLRSFAVFEDRNWMELFNGQGDSARFFNGQVYRYDITYSSSDESVVTVNKSGTVAVRGLGEATVTVTCGELSYDVTIRVVM